MSEDRIESLREEDAWHDYIMAGLMETEAELAAGAKLIPFDDVIAKMRKRIADYECENV